MTVKNIHIYRLNHINNGKLRADAEIVVPGLGIVKIEHSLTDETISRIDAESISALKFKLGQTLKDKNE